MAKEYYTVDCILFLLKNVHLPHAMYVRQAAVSILTVLLVICYQKVGSLQCTTPGCRVAMYPSYVGRTEKICFPILAEKQLAPEALTKVLHWKFLSQLLNQVQLGFILETNN